jgi:cellulose synthase/poly-beta-1,6-N-acetylglucosamine synthase-like glycosyltransferase
VCQFDADHVPQRNYLSTLLPAFLDPEVGERPDSNQQLACSIVSDALQQL